MDYEKMKREVEQEVKQDFQQKIASGEIKLKPAVDSQTAYQQNNARMAAAARLIK